MDATYIRRQLQKQLEGHPAALSAALSELESCVGIPGYVNAVTVELSSSSSLSIEEIILSWAYLRAEIWIDVFETHDRERRCNED